MIVYEYALIWHSQYGKEEVDSCDTRLEAKRLKLEYRLAFGEGHIQIKRRRSQTC
jgi:hypothetical protein